MKIGIIGGSGLEDPDILKRPQEVHRQTPYGVPSSGLQQGTISGVEVVLLSRHGRRHTIPPTQVNNRANIYALKEAGCTHVLTTTACGSLREKIRRGDLVFPDQFIDFTRFRKITFFEEFEAGNLQHAALADPFDAGLREELIRAAQSLKIPHHPRGTVITIEGPRFSTRAESQMFRSWGADIINMSVAPEAILAREIELPYATIAMSTDYDCWKKDEDPVTWEKVLQVFRENVHNVSLLITKLLSTL